MLQTAAKGFVRFLTLSLFIQICGESVAQEIKRPLILGIAAVELQVSDIKKSIAFYEGLLGLKVNPKNKESNDGLYLIQLNPRQAIILHGGLGAGQDERLLSISLETTDAGAMRSYLKLKGINVPENVSQTPSCLSFSIFDADKHPIKFVQNQRTTKSETTGNDAVIISNRILHVGLIVNDLETANAFYHDVLGLTEIWRGGMNDTTTNWINMRLPESTDYIEYMLFNKTPTRRQLGAMHHIALLTPDIQKALDTLRERAKSLGFEIGTPQIGRNNRWQLNLFDPDGTRIELMEPFTLR